MNSQMNVFEDPDFNESPESVIRPGGFEMTRSMMEVCAFPQGARIIDVGCGNGMTVEYLRREFKLNAVGTDISEALIEIGRKRSPGIPLFLGSGENMPFEDASAQGVLSECSLSVMPDIDRVLAEIHRVLVPGGKLAVSDVYIRNQAGAEAFRGKVQGRCSFNGMTREEMQRKLHDSGYELCRWEDRTDLWKAYVAGLILGTGSFKKLWGSNSTPQNADGCLTEDMVKARPGYFWMVARKR